MVIELRPLFSAGSGNIPVDCTVDMSQTEFYGSRPFNNPVRFTGSIVNRAGVVTLEGNVHSDYTVECDRCGKPLVSSLDFNISYVLVESMSGEQQDDYLVVEDGKLELDSVISTDVLLALPTKHLCKSDCKGLCSNCGANLNEGNCNCKNSDDNPFAAALSAFFDD